nr:hypothetical protein [Candidatus Enterovibrio escacola]
MFFPCREESLAKVVDIDEKSVYFIHAQVLIQSPVFFQTSDRDLGI